MKLAAILGATAVAAGAFGAHALADDPRLEIWKTAALYHLVHAVVLTRAPRVASWLFTAGILLFSGSLYALVLLEQPILGAVTPFGGILLIAGWLAMWKTPTP